MKVIFGLGGIKKYKNPVVALGVFDGVHLGHKKILQETVDKAKAIGGTSMVVTFWPHPQEEESLYSLEHRLRLIGQFGIDVCIVINFNQKFAQVSAVGFIKNILFKQIRARFIYVGKNFRFGKEASGDARTLVKFSQKYGYRIKLFKVTRFKNRPISSTYIRTLIKKGNIRLAERLLSRPVSILGTVIKGSLLGRKLGFPTANINPHHEVTPPQGVYAVRIILEGKEFYGLCYIGTRPTFSRLNTQGLRDKSKSVEAYIFNFDKKIYKKYLEIQFIEKIREEKKFPSCQLLVAQIKKDIASFPRVFPRHFLNHKMCLS